jgi:hypothetical protein
MSGDNVVMIEDRHLKRLKKAGLAKMYGLMDWFVDCRIPPEATLAVVAYQLSIVGADAHRMREAHEFLDAFVQEGKLTPPEPAA